VLDHTIRVGQVGDVLAQEREERPDAVRLKIDSRLQGGVKTLAREKPPDRAAGEAPPRHMRGKPAILSAPQEQPSH
jgi:hypothetical protein